jgi:hypothetical protein
VIRHHPAVEAKLMIYMWGRPSDPNPPPASARRRVSRRRELERLALAFVSGLLTGIWIMLLLWYK